MLTESPAVQDVVSATHVPVDGALWKQMCKRLTQRLAHVGLCVSVALCICAPAEPQRLALITSLRVDVLQDKVRVHIEADRMLSIQTTVLTQPDRIVLDAAGALFRVTKPEIRLNSGPVKSVHMALLQKQPPITRIVVDMSIPLAYSLRAERNSAFLDIALQPVPQTQAVTAGKPFVPPNVTYDRGLLTIVAENSSLAEILNAVHSWVGGTTEFPAAAANERATVKLGPAPLASVMAALLLGSPYDYVIVGSGQPGGIQIVLSEKSVRPESQGPTEAPVSPEDTALVNDISEAPTPDNRGAPQLSEGSQLTINQPSVDMPAGENISRPENEELPFDTPQTPPQKVRPSKEGPRIPPPGKGH